ncbi:uncharacterized protein LOC143854169 [Tasmannia lanceolata]|uniref:uncharacterized protein LOC143854169 n=1 Tax=Tasmannia lanceolata TaxID=3420 RepID=UPI004062F731
MALPMDILAEVVEVLREVSREVSSVKEEVALLKTKDDGQSVISEMVELLNEVSREMSSVKEEVAFLKTKDDEKSMISEDSVVQNHPPVTLDPINSMIAHIGDSEEELIEEKCFTPPTVVGKEKEFADEVEKLSPLIPTPVSVPVSHIDNSKGKQHVEEKCLSSLISVGKVKERVKEIEELTIDHQSVKNPRNDSKSVVDSKKINIIESSHQAPQHVMQKSGQGEENPAQKPKKKFTPLPKPPAVILRKLVKDGQLKLMAQKPPPKVLPRFYNKDEYCEYHQGLGHITNRCRSLKFAIQDLIDRDRPIWPGFNANQNPSPRRVDISQAATKSNLTVEPFEDPSVIIHPTFELGDTSAANLGMSELEMSGGSYMPAASLPIPVIEDHLEAGSTGPTPGLNP